MANKLQIWNKTLHRIGELRLSGLTEDSVNRRILDDIYDSDRRSVLEMHSWKFARAHRDLALNSSSPTFGYDNSFALPSDFIKIVYFNNTTPEYRERKDFEIVGSDLHTDESFAKITYIKDQTSENSFPPLFVECLVAYLAKNLAYTRTASASLAESLDGAFIRALNNAKHSDSGQDITSKPAMTSFPNINARFGGRLG